MSVDHSTINDVRGERRLLTIVFSDLVNWTSLTETMDIEDARGILEVSRGICVRAIQRYGGYVAQMFGDGILAYFGYPTALERSAQRAVNAALEMVRDHAAARWPVLLDGESGPRIRVGIHTGEVFVGDMTGAGGARDLDALAGSTPNIASRVQSAAAPNSVVVSEETYRLIEGQFEFRPLGAKPLKGITAPVPLYEVLARRSVADQWERLRVQRLRPLVGRADELARLRAAWREVCDGATRAIVVEGGAGIGKSRLVAELARDVRGACGEVVLEFQCSPYHTNASFFPVIRCLVESVLGLAAEATPLEAEETVRRAAAEAAPGDSLAASLAAGFVGLGDPDPAMLALPAEVRKARTMETVVRIFAASLSEAAKLYVFSDIHWADPSTLEWAALLRSRARGALIIFTTRPDAPTGVVSVADSGKIALESLPEAGVEELARSVAGGKVLPREVVRQIARDTGGLPLYVEELTRALLASGSLVEKDGYYELATFIDRARVPLALQDLIVARLDRLGEARSMAQLGAVLGAEFSGEMAMELWEGSDRECASRLLDELLEADILEPLPAQSAGGVFRFRHVLVRNTAYESLLKTTRARYHRRIAERLLASGTGSHRTDPGLVAQHFRFADMHEAAVPFLLKAATESLGRSACVEAAAHANDGLRAIEALGRPAQLREVEMMLSSTMGTSLMTTRGFAAEEVGHAFARAQDVSRQLGVSERSFQVVWGLWVFHLMRGDLGTAAAQAAEMLELGRTSGDDGLLIEALWAGGAVAVWRGQLASACALLKESVGLYRPCHHRNAFLFGQNPGVAARVYLALALTFCGQTEEAVRHSREALELAREVDHPHSIAWALGGCVVVRLVGGDVAGTLEIGDQAMHYCMEQQHAFWLCAATMMVGWARMQRGEFAGAHAMMEKGFAAYERMGTALAQPAFYALLADCNAACGDFERARFCAHRGIEIAGKSGEELSMPGLLLVRGQLSMRDGPAAFPAAGQDFRQALALAHAHGSGVRVLQATAALAHLLAARGLAAEALALLGPFAPMIEAQGGSPLIQPIRQLLDALRNPPEPPKP